MKRKEFFLILLTSLALSAPVYCFAMGGKQTEPPPNPLGPVVETQGKTINKQAEIIEALEKLVKRFWLITIILVGVAGVSFVVGIAMGSKTTKKWQETQKDKGREKHE
ncbi:MAG: hypothetical protein LBT05_09610 [Planctomycetaceae bacterium]|jgi:hypothetical protein|nr:hypothetical protein [Planctomycetaceae bacterium]